MYIRKHSMRSQVSSSLTRVHARERRASLLRGAGQRARAHCLHSRRIRLESGSNRQWRIRPSGEERGRACGGAAIYTYTYIHIYMNMYEYI